MGHVLLMGRRTFESIGRPLPGRQTVVLSRAGFAHDGVHTVSSPDEVEMPVDRDIFVCGGAQIYEQLLPRCSTLYLTHVKCTVDGDALFPDFEDLFEPQETLDDNQDFRIVRYRRRLPPEQKSD